MIKVHRTFSTTIMRISRSVKLINSAGPDRNLTRVDRSLAKTLLNINPIILHIPGINICKKKKIVRWKIALIFKPWQLYGICIAQHGALNWPVKVEAIQLYSKIGNQLPVLPKPRFWHLIGLLWISSRHKKSSTATLLLLGYSVVSDCEISLKATEIGQLCIK